MRQVWLILGVGLVAQPLGAQELVAGPEPGTESLMDALSEQEWDNVERSVDKALAWLAKQQKRDGSFSAPDRAQPAVTGLAVMAFLSRGHLPGPGLYGVQLEKAIDFTLGCQRSSGLFSYADPGPVHRHGHASKSATYNHAIAGLMLTEVYGMTDRDRAARLEEAIVKALEFTRRLQTRPKRHAQDSGGWRYLYPVSSQSADSDLSVTAWQLMFLRSARNAEFEVSKQQVDEAVDYVLGCWDEGQGVFLYTKVPSDRRWSRGMVGAGVLSLSMAGRHQTAIAQRAGDWLVGHPFRYFGERQGGGDRFFYSTYYCSQAMAQLGGDRWRRFFPVLASTLVKTQQSAGNWPPEPYGNDGVFGESYSTAMAVLSLTPPLQLLPVYQR